jgi:endo-1,4-beta-xylanase
MYPSLTRFPVLGTLLGALCLTLLASGPVQAQIDLNTNGSFEDTEAGVITDLAGGIEGWVLEVGSSVEVAPEFAVVDDVAQEGDQALRITVNGTGDNPWDLQAIGDMIPVEPGETYTLSVWARADEEGAEANFTVGNYDFAEYGRLGNESITTEWQEYTLDFTITDEETVIRAPIHFSFAVNVGNAIYIDNLSIFDPDAEDPTAFPIIVEAESGTLGSEFETVTEDDVTYLAPTTNFVDANFPGENRTVSYEVTFPASGWYGLYARLYVGPSTFDDDSFFYADTFGVQDPMDAEDWIVANQLASAGFTEPDEFVTGIGGAQSEVWKWVNISENSFNEVPSDSFFVESGALTQTFEIGAREDGLRFDKFAFGRSDLYFTVANLDNVEAGVTELPIDEPDGPPLAAGLDKFLGNIYSQSQLLHFEHYWNQVTPENAGKWGSVEGTRDVMNWTALDNAYNLAKDNGWPFRFHVLVWGNQQPSWMATLPQDEQLEEIEEWFTAVAERYPDIDYLEVVNEPLHDPPDDAEDGGYIEALGGSGDTGWDWIITSFEMAREIFPEDTRLVLNDYNILNSQINRIDYREIVDLLQERDLIDVIAVQGHAFSTREPVSTLTATLDYLGATGLPIQIAEMDVDGNPQVDPNVTEEESDQTQLEDMQRIFPALWEHPSVEGITLWGWKPGLWRQDQEAYLVRTNGEERPAMEWLREYLENYVPTSTEPGAEAAPSARLLSNYPNPFRPTTQIGYVLTEPAEVTLTVYDVLGREVLTLVDEHRGAGEHTVRFDATGLASGVYLYRLQAGSVAQTRHMVLLR